MFKWFLKRLRTSVRPIGSERRSARRKHLDRAWPRLEWLEERLAPAVSSSLSGTTLLVNLSAANDHAYLETTSGNIVIDDNPTFNIADAAYAS